MGIFKAFGVFFTLACFVNFQFYLLKEAFIAYCPNMQQKEEIDTPPPHFTCHVQDMIGLEQPIATMAIRLRAPFFTFSYP